MKLDKYRGIIPAFYACYDKAGEVSEDGVRALTRYFVDQGVKGVYVGGSSGECIYQSVEDRKKTLEAVMDEARAVSQLLPMLPATIQETAAFWQPMPRTWVWTGLRPYRPFISSCLNILLPGTGMIYRRQRLRRISLSITYHSWPVRP